MPDDKLIEVFLNPLQFNQVDEPRASIGEKELSPADFINFICTPGIGSDIESLIKRYKEISVEKIRLIAAHMSNEYLISLCGHCVMPKQHTCVEII
jgi:allophanate hydrolase subunit 1